MRHRSLRTAMLSVLVLAVLLSGSAANADHGGTPNIVATPNSGLSDSGPVTVNVEGTGFAGQQQVSVMQCLGQGNGGYSCGLIGTPPVVNGGFSIDVNVQYDFAPSNPDNDTCNWSDTESCYIKAAEGDVFSGPQDTADIVFEGHDTRTPANAPPICTDGSATGNEDTAIAVTIDCSDSDAGDSLAYTIVDQPDAGQLSGTAPNLTYTPNANTYGGDSFTFKANDGDVDSNVATSSVTVNSVNDPPVATADSYIWADPVVVSAPGVLGNDTDVDTGDARQASLVSATSNGALTLNADGSFTYTPSSTSPSRED